MHRFAALALLALSGCFSHAAIQTAHTVGKGKFQGAVEPGVGLAVGPVVGAFPNVMFAGRFGVADRVDLGARFGSNMYEITSKFQLNDGGPDTFVMSLAPSFSVMAGGFAGFGAGYAHVQTPLLLGIPVGRSQFILGPNLDFNASFAGVAGLGGGSAIALSPGAHFGFSGKVSDLVRLHPELSVKVPVLGATAATASGTTTGGAAVGVAGALVGVNFGFLFGGD